MNPNTNPARLIFECLTLFIIVSLLLFSANAGLWIFAALWERDFMRYGDIIDKKPSRSDQRYFARRWPYCSS